MIKHVIFDLGNVLVDLHPQKAFKAFSENCATSVSGLQTVFLSPLHNDFMSGKITPEQLFLYLKRTYKCDVTFDQFTKNWNLVIGKLKTGIKGILKNLLENYEISICSNVDPLHWQYCLKQFPEILMVKNFFLSYEMKMIKPDPRIFEYMTKKLSAEAEACLFIDDTKMNTKVAGQLGYKTIHSSDPKIIKKQLIEMKLLSVK